MVNSILKPVQPYGFCLSRLAANDNLPEVKRLNTLYLMDKLVRRFNWSKVKPYTNNKVY